MSSPPAAADSDRLRHIARHIPGVIYEFVQYPDGRGAFPYVSEGLVDLYGIEPELIREDAGPMFAAVHPEDLERVTQSVQDAADQFIPWQCEHRIYHQDGRLRWVQGDATPRREADGSIRWYGYVRDMTEQKASRLALEASEQKLRRVLDTINGLVFMIAPDLTLSLLNPLMATVSGYDSGELLHRPIADGTHPDDLAYCIERVQACLHGESSRGIEFRALHGDGHYYWYSANLSPFTAEDGAIVSCLGIATYIHDRKQADLALQESEARYQSLVTNVPGMVYRYLPNADSGTFTYVSAGCYELFGLEPAQALQDASAVWALVHPDDLPSLQASVASAVERSADWAWEGRFHTVTGQVRWCQGRSRPQLTGEGLVWDGLLIDITALKQTEAALSQEVGYRRALFEASGDGIVVLDSAGQVLEANHSFAAMLGYSFQEVIGLNVADFDVALGSVESKQETFDLRLDRFERRHRRRDGSTYAVEICASAVQWHGQSVYLCVCRDIEDRQRAERALAASETRFQQLTAASPAVIYSVVESESGIVCFDYISPAVEEVDEIPVAAAMQNGALLSEQIHPEDRERYLATYRASLQAMTTFSCEWRIITSSGKTKWLQASSRPERRSNGEVVWHGIVLETTAQKQAELEILELQTALLEAQEIAHIGNWAFDLASQRITWSPELFRLFGLDLAAGEPTSDAYLQMIHPDDRPLLVQAVDQAITQGTPYKIDYRALLPDGSIRHHEGRGKIERDGAGQISRLIGTCLDITERKQSELALLASETRFRGIFDQAAAGINQADASGRFIEANQYFCDLLGYTRDELLNLTVQAVTHPEDLHQSAISRLFRGELKSVTVEKRYRQSVTVEKRYRHKQGDWIWTEVTLSVIHDAAGAVISDLAIVLDIRNFKQASAALQTSEIRFRAIFDQVAAGINQIDASGRFVEANQYYCNLLGYSRAELLKLTFADVVHPEDLARYRPQIDRIMRGELDRLDYEKRDRHKNGDWVWTKISISVLRDAAGQVIGNLAVVVDIRDHRRAEARIAQQLYQQTALGVILRQIRESLDLEEILSIVTRQVQAIFQCDRVIVFRLFGDGRSQIVEEAVKEPFPALKAMQWEDEVWSQEILDLYWQGQPRIVPDVMADRWTDCLVEYSEAGQIKSKVVASILQEVRTASGDRWVAPGNHNQLWGVLVIHACQGQRVWHDTEAQLLQQIANQLAIAIQQVTIFNQLQQELGERQRAQQQLSDRNQELAIANQDLSRATRLKDEFLANMSHELRTPLNVILGFAQILNSDPSLQTQQREYVRIMQRSGDHLLHLINEILDLSKIEANRITLEPESIDLFSLLRDLQAMFQERAEDKDLGFTLALASDLPQYVVADPNKLRQVLINLLSNAVKFTQEGGIALRVGLCPGPEPDPDLELETHPAQAYLVFAVEDTGTGIAPDELTVIFDAFIQAKAGKTSLEGTGLGLAISRSLVHLMGGDLTVDSTPGEGSTFRFILPLQLAEAADVAAVDNLDLVIGLAPGQPTHRILVVDDQPENRYFLVAALSNLGLTVQEATNGAEAIARWQQWHPHLIWMDLRMPEIDGYEATRSIRAAAQERGDGLGPVIIALTAQSSRDQRRQALAAGCDEVISKPVQLNLLLTKMADHLGLRYRYADQEQSSLAPSSASRLEASALRVMPPEWVSALHRASVQCDSAEVAQLLQQIPGEHQALIKGLTQLLQDFKFELLMQLTQP